MPTEVISSFIGICQHQPRLIGKRWMCVKLAVGSSPRFTSVNQLWMANCGNSAACLKRSSCLPSRARLPEASITSEDLSVNLASPTLTVTPLTCPVRLKLTRSTRAPEKTREPFSRANRSNNSSNFARST